MLYVYRRNASDSARLLAEAMAVNCRKISNVQQPHYGAGLRPDDVVICWGEQLAAPPGVRVLNGGPLRSKLEDAVALQRAGVSTVRAQQTRPPTQAVVPPVFTVANPRMDRREAQNLIQQLTTFINTPDRSAEVWLPRRNNHIGGADLLNPPAQPDFWSKKEDFVREFRVHCFKGHSIRAGQKGHREGVAQPHPWIRSYDGGWAINYNGFTSTREMRRLAAAAITALGLDFGAVDVGQRATGELVVLEVNRGPGLEGGTVDSYARAIEGWLAPQAGGRG